MNNDILLGRGKELRTINNLIDNKRNIIVFGQDGVGVTSIIQKVIHNVAGGGILYSPHSRTLKEALINLLLSAQVEEVTVHKMDTRALRTAFYKVLTRHPRYVILDHLGRVTPKYYSFLNYLIDRGIPLMVASHGLRKEDIGHLCVLLVTFEKVEVRNFGKRTTALLVEHFMNEFGIQIADKEQFKREVFNVSNGNPKIIRKLCFLARDPRYQQAGVLNVKLIDLDRRINAFSRHR